MPELPEVQTIATQLQEILPFKVKAMEKSTVIKSILKQEDFNPVGKTIIKIERKGKSLLLHFSTGEVIFSGFGMSGSWRFSKEKMEIKHTHLQFEGPHFYLGYIDPRRFGLMYFYSKENFEQKRLEMGVDISTSEFNENYIYETLKKYPERELKHFLLDQKYFAGSGNYIANEICAHAGIRPTRRAGKVTRKEVQKIKAATSLVLNNSIETNGVTFSGGYADTQGEKGEGVSNLVVFYQKICQLCGVTKVKKIYLKQRGTYYCPLCQK